MLSKEFQVELNDVNESSVGYKWTNGMTSIETIDIEDLLPGSIRISFALNEDTVGPFGSIVDYKPWVVRKVLESNLTIALKFAVDNQEILPMSIPDYLKLWNRDSTVVNLCNGDAEVYAMLTPNDGHIRSFVNRHHTVDDGAHVTAFLKMFGKGKKPVTYGKVLSERAIIYINVTMPGPDFNGQAKDKLTSTNLPKFTLLEDEDVADFQAEIEESIDIMAKLIKQPSKAKRSASVKVEKLHDAILAGGDRSKECTLILTEGDSAKTFAVSGMAIVGHDLFGVFPLRGKALNVSECDEERILSNAEWKSVLTILGLTLGIDGDAAIENMRYGKVLVLADADLDGVHISGLVMNFFASQYPRLLSSGILQLFRTPVVKAKDTTGSIREFYSMDEFNSFVEPLNSIQYYKGLGSSSRDEARGYFTRFNELVRNVEFREGSSPDVDMLNAMFARNSADKRKQLILDHIKSPEPTALLEPSVSAETFVRTELLQYSAHDVLRSIPNAIDGLKTSQRKILHVARSMGSTKVAQLASTVALKTMYLHGETSLADCIIGLAQDFVGSNNQPLLKGSGQFGSRLQGGKDSASPRYVHAAPSEFLKATFLKEDDELLDYKREENCTVEPYHYVPLVPIVLLNGARGIGTGFSSFVPNHSLNDILDAITDYLSNADSAVSLTPFYKGFTGSISWINSKWSCSGTYNRCPRRGDTTIITELPVGTFTEPFIVKLKALPSVTRVVSRCDDLKVHIECRVSSSDDLKKIMTTSIAHKNLHLLDRDGHLRRFNSTGEILRYFVDVRLDYYAKRKAAQLVDLDKKIANKIVFARFVHAVLDKGIVAFSTDATAFMLDHDLGEHQALTKTPLLDISERQIAKTEADIKTLQAKKESINGLSPKHMYLKDIEALKAKRF